MTKKVKIYGERNTGTHFLEAVIRANFRCELLPRAGRIIWPNLHHLMTELGLAGAERFYFEEAMQDDGHLRHNEQSLGWKHACPPLEIIQRYPHLEQLVCVVITKDPYSWIHSFYRRPYHKLYMKELSFSEFIRHYWLTTRRDNLAVSIFKKPIGIAQRQNSVAIMRFPKCPVLLCIFRTPNFCLTLKPAWKSLKPT